MHLFRFLGITAIPLFFFFCLFCGHWEMVKLFFLLNPVIHLITCKILVVLFWYKFQKSHISETRAVYFFLFISRMHRGNLTCLVKLFITIPACNFGEQKLFSEKHGFEETEMCYEYMILFLWFSLDFINTFKRATAGTRCCFVSA